MAAREEGLVRAIGVTGHGTQIAATHRRSLERFDFDSVLLPYNYVTMRNPYYAENFEALYATCQERGVAVQTIKSIALRHWRDRPHTRSTWYEPLQEQGDIDLAVWWALSRPGVFVNSVGDVGLLPKVLDEAHELGHQFVVCPNVPDEKAGLDGYRKAADVLNHAGAIAKQSGIRIGYHNHGTELAPINGVRPYDVMLERTDPALVAMEMDIFWMVQGGGDPLAYFRKYPGRFRMVHVKDMDGSPAKRMVDVGKGIIDWKAIFAQAGEGEIEHYFVEHDDAPDPFASMAASYAYLRGLEY